MNKHHLNMPDFNRFSNQMIRLYKVAGTVGMGLFILCINTRVASNSRSAATLVDTLVLGDVVFVKISGGSFAMGNNSSQAEPNEQPVHIVTLSSFWMARTEITFMQWKNFLDQTGYPKGRSQAKGANHPIVSITWEDAQAYCRWFSKKHGVLMRLPSEAEWEFAARGGLDGKQFPNGDNISSNEANYATNGPLPVAQYPANGYGLYDMAGNVFEWIGDWYDKDYYKVSPNIDPHGPATENGKLQRHGDRGGGWCAAIDKVRVSARHAGPGSWDAGGTADCLGFRPILEGVAQRQ